jgi:hypothetical protein
LDAATCERMVGHEHCPVQAADLVGAARATLTVVLAEEETVQHEPPIADGDMARRQRYLVGNPGGAGTHSVHRDAKRAAHLVPCVHGVHCMLIVRGIPRRHPHARHLRRPARRVGPRRVGSWRRVLVLRFEL